jgi:transcriptional regulator with XRE-family HTH domain
MRQSPNTKAAKPRSSGQLKPLAEALKDWRTARGLSARDAAEALGMSSRTVEGIEQSRPFRYEKILRLAIKALD